MRRIISSLFLGMLFMVFTMPAYTVYAQESYDDYTILGWYMGKGTLTEGSALEVDDPWWNYTFANITQDGKPVSAESMNVSDAYNSTFEFDVLLDDDCILMSGMVSDPGDTETYATVYSNNGTERSGTLMLELKSQKLHVIFRPGDFYDQCMEMQLSAVYQYTFIYQDSKEMITDEFSYTESYYPYFHEDTGEYKTVDISSEFMVLSSYGDSRDITITLSDNEYISFAGVLNSIPFAFQDGEFYGSVEPGSGYTPDYETTDEYSENVDETETADPVEAKDGSNTGKVAAAVTATILVGATAGAAAVGSAAGSAATGGTGSLVDAFEKKAEEEKLYYTMIINGGCELTKVVCEKGKSLVIPIRIENGENEKWIYVGKSICEKNHNKRIQTEIEPTMNGTALLTLHFTGEEVVKKETVQCMVTAFQEKKLSKFLFETFEFELIPETEPQQT